MIRRDERNCTYGKPVNAFKTPQLKMVRIPMIRFILRGWKKGEFAIFICHFSLTSQQFKMVRIPVLRVHPSSWNCHFCLTKVTYIIKRKRISLKCVQIFWGMDLRCEILWVGKNVDLLEQVTIYNTKEQVLTCRIHSLENMCDYTTPCIQSLWECTKGWLKDIKINILIGLATVVPPYISMHRVFFK